MKPPYEITNIILELITSISEKLGEVNAAHLQKPPTELRKRNRIKTIQSSLGIEGNSLTEEQITAILENKRIGGPAKDIAEVKNAIAVYDRIKNFNHTSIASFCRAHAMMMKDLATDAGKLRRRSVGIVRGKKLAHLAPPGERIPALMKDLFDYLKKDKELILIKSCVFHYELEFIHPFTDGNGRMGRLWQTVILMKKYPVFEYLPVESLIKQNQKAYYDVLAKCDKTGSSTLFISFMLEKIERSLETMLQTQNFSLSADERIHLAKEKFQGDSFTRLEYLRHFKALSTATASRDLRIGVDKGILKKTGDKRTTKYKFRKH